MEMLKQRDGSLLKKNCIIVDLDGTLADCEHRREFVECKDWKGFYERMGADRLNSWCKYLIQNRIDTVDIVVTSGRPEEYREVTDHWLDVHQIERAALFMRPTGDYRPDHVVKQEILERDIRPRWDVFFAIDDRKQVVDMWRRNGIVTLQCAEGDF